MKSPDAHHLPRSELEGVGRARGILVDTHVVFWPAFKPPTESIPKDPADRIIGAAALVEGLSLLTADHEIRRLGVLRTIW